MSYFFLTQFEWCDQWDKGCNSLDGLMSRSNSIWLVLSRWKYMRRFFFEFSFRAKLWERVSMKKCFSIDKLWALCWCGSLRFAYLLLIHRVWCQRLPLEILNYRKRLYQFLHLSYVALQARRTMLCWTWHQSKTQIHSPDPVVRTAKKYARQAKQASNKQLCFACAPCCRRQMNCIQSPRSGIDG